MTSKTSYTHAHTLTTNALSQTHSLTHTHTIGCPSVLAAENTTALCALRFPLLQCQSEVNGMYLRCFLHCQKDMFLLPLDAPAFAFALSSEAWGTTDHLPSNVPILSNGEYRCVVHLCLSRLIQDWSQNLSVGLWCDVLAPTVLSTMRTCTQQLAEPSDRAGNLPPVELIRCCISCIITLTSYLRANMKLGDLKGEDAYTKTAQKTLVAVGASCSELLDAVGLLLSDLVFHCVGVIRTKAFTHTQTVEGSSGDPVYTSSVLALEATTALMATMSLLLGEDAHIERVRLREFLSRQAGVDETVGTAVTSKSDAGVASQSINLKLRTPSFQSVNLEQLSYVETDTPNPSTPRTPRTPGTPNLLAETAKRLDVARQALRRGNNRLLASLVTCCQIDVARVAPKATLSAISALHLLIGMETDDEESVSPRYSSIFLSPPPRSLVDILCDFGLPGFLIETAVLYRSHTDSTVETDEQQRNEQSNVIQTKLHRWSTHPLFTSDRFIQSTVPPVQFLSSPRNRSKSAALTDESSTPNSESSVPLESLPKALHGILDDIDCNLKSDFKIASLELKTPGDSSSSCTEALTVARECVELLRLMAICPANAAVQSLNRSVGSISPSNSFGSNIEVRRSFPITMSTFSLSVLNDSIRLTLMQLLTPPMVFVMMTDAPLFLRSLNSPVPIIRPLLVWDDRIRNDMLAVLEVENRIHISTLNSLEQKAVSTASDEVASSAVTGLKSPEESSSPAVEHELTRATLHSHMSSECLVDNVYIRHLAPRGGKRVHKDSVEGREENCADDIGVRDLARFLENLQASISSSKVVIKHVQNTSNATQLVQLKAQLALKEKVLTEMLADHDELGYGYADLYLDS